LKALVLLLAASGLSRLRNDIPDPGRDLITAAQDAEEGRERAQKATMVRHLMNISASGTEHIATAFAHAICSQSVVNEIGLASSADCLADSLSGEAASDPVARTLSWRRLPPQGVF